jgi:small subunit ribosomal protein S6
MDENPVEGDGLNPLSGINHKEEILNHYELMVLFSPNLTDEEEKAQTLQVEELLKREKAEMIYIDHWGKRKLAYPVRKQRQGYYEWFYFSLEPARLAEIDRKLKMSETALRFMIIKMEKIQTQNVLKEAERRQQAAAPPAPAVSETPSQPVEEMPAEEPAAPVEPAAESSEPNPES